MSENIDSGLETALRQAITDSGLTHYAIAHQAGIATAAIDRFMTQNLAQKRGLTLSSAGKIADALGYGLEKLEEDPPPKKSATKKR